MGSPTSSTRALHAAIAPAPELVDERRTLYRLAAGLFGAELSDNLADHPIVRYEIGRVLAGHGDLSAEQLLTAAALEVRDAGLPVVSDVSAPTRLDAPLRIIAAPGTSPRPLTAADGERFEHALEIVAEGVRLLSHIAPEMAEDLLVHVSMIAVLNRDTSGGVVSASSRYVPGLVLIDEPTTPIEVAEALVHEGAHEKFFDLAITRDFLDSRAEQIEHFEPSWNRVRWPLEQVYAAWHAYTCLAEFSIEYDAGEFGPVSLLAVAGERATEIGRWLLEHESALGFDARWLLHALLGEPAVRDDSERDDPVLGFADGDQFTLRLDVHFLQARSGRVVSGSAAVRPTALFWLSHDASDVVGHISNNSSPRTYRLILEWAADHWQVDSAAASGRLRRALGLLVTTRNVGHEPDLSR